MRETIDALGEIRWGQEAFVSDGDFFFQLQCINFFGEEIESGKIGKKLKTGSKVC